MGMARVYAAKLAVQIFGLACLSFLGFGLPKIKADEAVPRFIDLSSWDGQARELNIPWDFYEGQLLTGSEAPALGALALIPGIPWYQVKNADGKVLPSYGYGTYRLEIHGLKVREHAFTLLLRAAGSAYQATLYRKGSAQSLATVSSGHVGRSESEEIPARTASVLRFTPETAGDFVLLVQVSNFTNYAGGLWSAPLIGYGELVTNFTEGLTLQNAAVMGCLGALGLYLFFLWLRRKESWESLCLAAAAALAMARLLATDDQLLRFMPPGSYLWFRKLEFAAMPWGTAAMLGFFILAYPGSPLRIPWAKIMMMLGGLLGLLTLLLPPKVFTPFLAIYQLYLLLIWICFLVVIVSAARRRLPSVSLSLAGLSIMLVCLITDILIVANLVHLGTYLTPLSIAIMMVLQSQVVAQRAARAFADAERMTIELKEQERARTLFFHNTSHELRTPLNGIIGFLDLMRDDRFGVVPQTVKTQIQKILRLAESLKLQVNTILDLAKSKRGELSLRIQNLTLGELKDEIDQLAEGLCLKSPQLQYQSSLNAGEEAFYGDKEKLLTILRNLIGNAFKFRASDRENKVELRLNYSQGTLQIEVEDTGIGIPEAYRDKIFEEFGQVDGDARRSYEGTGLGLSMVRDLVKLMQGTLRVSSTVGAGSTFSLSIPTRRAEDISLESASGEDREASSLSEESSSLPLNESEKTPARELSQGGENDFDIFVIDDNETNCEVIAGILGASGYRVRYAVSGRSGLLDMRSKRPDLLLLDMMMPEMSGEDVIRELRKDPLLQEVPVILITARASEEDRIEGLKLGVDDYLPKPIFAAELRLRVRNMVLRHTLLRKVERSEQEQKLLQLGEMFRDLSHELKNIVQGGELVQGLSLLDGQLSAAALSFDSEVGLAYAKGLSLPPYSGSVVSRLSQIPTPVPAQAFGLERYLVEFNLDEQEVLNLWQNILLLSEDELVFAKSQMRIFSEHKFMQVMLERCRDLTLNILQYTRSAESLQSVPLTEAWRQTQILLRGRQRGYAVEWREQGLAGIVAIPPSKLVQVLLNLCLNAIDAMKTAEVSEPWIEIQVRVEGQNVLIRVSNAGEPISKEIQSKLFQKGFSSKGEQGSGIGLSVSRRLIVQAGGMLTYDEKAAHPSFVMSLPLVN